MKDKLKPCIDNENTLCNRPASTPKPDTAATTYFPGKPSRTCDSATLSAAQIFILVNLKKEKQTVVINLVRIFCIPYALNIFPCFGECCNMTFNILISRIDCSLESLIS